MVTNQCYIVLRFITGLSMFIWDVDTQISAASMLTSVRLSRWVPFHQWLYLNLRYLPYIRPIFQAQISGNIPTISMAWKMVQIFSILGSWNSYWLNFKHPQSRKSLVIWSTEASPMMFFFGLKPQPCNFVVVVVVAVAAAAALLLLCCCCCWCCCCCRCRCLLFVVCCCFPRKQSALKSIGQSLFLLWTLRFWGYKHPIFRHTRLSDRPLLII